jgi:iron complex outermembrane receptor protein
MLDINYGITAQSDIITTVGQRRSGESLAGYAVSNLTAKISDFDWSVTFYVDNLFDKYAFVSTRAHQGYQGMGDIEINRTDLQRGYGHFLLRPRTVGVTFSYQFEM